MKVAIMQPYFMPYIGYFQLINAVDTFVVYDNIKYTKKGWINRNRILNNGKDVYITLPLKKDSDYLNINQRFLSSLWEKEKKKFLNKINESYKKAPNFKEASVLIIEILNFENNNLFDYIFNSIIKICYYLEIKTKIVKSSHLDYNNELKAEEKVIEICKSIKSNKYYNPIGGLELYDKNDFLDEKIELKFLKTNDIIYNQFENNFIPFLSIIDVIMFNDKTSVKNYLKNYTEL